jgi:hypothetical protein
VVTSVIVPVVESLLIVLSVVSERTGPLNVVLAISISLSWQMSAAECNCQGAFTIHHLVTKRKRLSILRLIRLISL